MALIKTAAEILGGRPRPTDAPMGRGGGRPLKYGTRYCKLRYRGCDRVHWGHGYCRPHGRKFLLYGDPLWVKGRPIKCTCTKCPVHAPDPGSFAYKGPERRPEPMGRKKGRTCQTPGCTRPHHGNGLCKTCGRTKEKWGDAQHVYVATRTGRCGCEQHTAR